MEGFHLLLPRLVLRLEMKSHREQDFWEWGKKSSYFLYGLHEMKFSTVYIWMVAIWECPLLYACWDF